MELLQCTTSLPRGSWQWNSCNALPHCPGAADSATSAMHCLTALGQWAVQLLQCTAALPGGSGQCNSCNAMPHCLGAVGSATPTPATHCLTAWGQWAVQLLQCTASLYWGQWTVQLLQCTASLPGGQWAVELLQCTAPLPGGSGWCNSCNALPHCPGAVGSGTPVMHCLTAWGQRTVQPLQCTASLPGGSGQCNSCHAPPHCPGAVGSETPAMHYLTAWGQWAVQLLQCTAPLPGSSGQWNSCNAPPHCPGGSGQCSSCNALPHCLGAVDSATPAMHRLSALGQWAVNLRNALPHCLGAVGSGTPAMHCPTAWGQWAVELLQCTAALLGGSGQRNSCNALPHWLGGSGQWTSGNTLPHCPGGSEQCSSCITLPHSLGAVDSATPAMHCLTVWGQWAAELLQCTASLPGGSGQWNSYNALPRCLGAVGSATSAIHCRTAWGQWAAQLLQCTASLPWGSGERNSCNALPHCLEQWAVQLLQCTASLPGGSGQCNSCNGWSECSAGPVGMYYCAHWLGGMGSPTQGVVGASFRAYRAIIFGEPGAPAWGGRGVQARGWSEPPAGPMGRRHLLITGRTGLGGRGAPRGWSEPPARPMGSHHLPITGRTSFGGTGCPAQGVAGASCQGQWGAIFFREPGAPARGGRGVLPRGCPESPARPMGGHLLQRTGRTGPGGTGSPAQGVFGVSCQANGGPSSSENRAHRPWGGWGVQPRGCSESPARPRGGHLLQRTGRTGPGGTGSPAQWVFGVSCQANGGPSSSENWAHRTGGDGESCPGGVRSLLPGQSGASIFRKPGAPARGGRGVQPRGCSESPARPAGGHLLQRTGRTGPGGTGSPAQGVFGVSCQAHGGPSSSENRAHQPGGDRESCPGGVWSLLPGQGGAISFREPGAPAWGGRGVLPRGCSESPARPMGGHLLQRTGRTGPGGTVSPAQGVFGVSCQANGGPSSSKNWAHRPGGDGESCPGGVRSLLPGQGGAIFFREPGAPARGGQGVLPRGCSESPARPMGGHLLQRTGRTGPGGNGESSPGGVRSLLQGQRGAIFFREPGAPARGGQGVLPRGCSKSPARPRGGHLLQRTGRTGPGGTGSPAQGVFGVSCQANGGPSSSENRAHRPGGDGESCPGGVRSLLPGQWGAIFFKELGAPARGGRGVLPRGCSESPARPRGGHLLQRTGRTGPGGTGSPAQGVFGVSCQANGGPSSSENRAHRPGVERGVLPGGCSESSARPRGGHLRQRTGRTGMRRTGSPAQGVFGASCQASGGPVSSGNRAHRPGGDGEPSPLSSSRQVSRQYWGS